MHFSMVWFSLFNKKGIGEDLQIQIRITSVIWLVVKGVICIVHFVENKLNCLVYKVTHFCLPKKRKKIFLCLQIVHLKKTRIDQLKHHGDKKNNNNSSIIQMTHEIIMTLLRIIDNISHQIIYIALLSIFIGIENL